MKRLLFSIFIFHFSFSVSHADTVKPWTFWYWMYGAVSEQGIKADLQAMKDVGLGGCYLMPIRGAAERPEYQGTADALSENFWRMVDCALAQADSLGLGMGIHVCDGFALAGGPWIKPEESMQKIVFCDTIMSEGFRHFRMSKPQHYENYYEDIAVYAIPISQQPIANSQRLTYSPEVTVNAKGVYCADAPCWIQYEFDTPTLVRNIEIEPSGTNFQCQRLKVRASDDGIVFYDVKQLTPPRQGWQNTGFNTTFSIPPTHAKYFRFEWTPEGTEPGAEDLDAAKWKPVLRLKNIKLGSWSLIDNWEGKAGYVWRIAPDTPQEDLSVNDYLRPSDLIRGELVGDLVEIDLPKGMWRILRMGHTSTGHTNATAGGAKGLECDKFSKEAVEKQVENWFGLFMNRPNHKAIQYLHVDSWECGSQNWSKNFAQEFERRRGYDLIPLLPVYAGVPMKDGEKILRDIRMTINELVNEVFFTTVAQKAKDYGVQLSSESVAPTMVSDGMEHYKYVDVPMGEYWLNSPTHDKPNDMLDAIHGGHVYGKKIIQAEGFTEVRGVWDETPASIKALLDRNFALGMNRLFFHVNTHNPWLNKKPGMTLDGIGLFFQRDQTWFAEAKPFVDYITRCQTLLQKGKPVVDIAVYIGEEMPCRALTPDRLVPMLPGLFGAERVASERKRLANVGQPMEESPVGVRHSAGILDLKDWINPLHGYQYDSMNKDALLHQPFNYKALVIPTWTRVSPETKTRIEELRQQGVLIIDKPYEDAQLKNMNPDVVLPEGIAYTHRTDTDCDIYFLANQQDQKRSVTVSFRCIGRTPYIYNPVTDEWFKADYTEENGRTNVTLTLSPYGSLFVSWGGTNSSIGWNKQFHRVEQSVPWHGTNSSPYHITFKESGITLDNQQLFDWSQHADDRIRYFSGHARYTTTWKLKKDQVPQGRAWLSFPNVKDIAHVWINGKDCGIAWTAPYEVEITGVLQKGKNTIEIEVVNTWHNALRGLDQGKAPYEGIWTNAKYRTKGDGLLPAGLLEQPELKIEQ
ncbi:MAG: DNA-binding protein [Prevotella sp.]|nr:DNA-binding protein [Prevotella sp.]